MVTILVIALAAIALVCGMGAINDIRDGSSRHADEEVGARRDQLPLNFWMGVANKAFGMFAALGIAVALLIYF